MPSGFLNSARSWIAAGLAAGIVTGATAWLLLGAGAAASGRLEATRTELQATQRTASRRSSDATALSILAGHPLFALTNGPGAVAEPVVRMSGLACWPGRKAALLSVDGAAEQWILVGQAAGQVTLIDVLPTRAVVETPFGRKDVGLSSPAAASSGPAPGPGLAVPSTPDAIPGGVRLPPPPASALHPP